MALLDLLSSELKNKNIRVVAEEVYLNEINRYSNDGYQKTTSIKPAKNLIEVYSLIGNILINYQDRENIPEDNRILLTEEEPPDDATGEIITVSLVSQSPGSYSQGAPLEGRVKNQKPLFRETLDDTENPGYKLSNFGYWFDNVIRFTCWARSNKQANIRAEWLQMLFENYGWYISAEGIPRFLFLERQGDTFFEKNGNRWFGRPLDYYVKTETIRTVKEKTIEEIILHYSTKSET